MGNEVMLKTNTDSTYYYIPTHTTPMLGGHHVTTACRVPRLRMEDIGSSYGG